MINIIEPVKVLRLPVNAIGRDFACGDIHGEWDQLMDELKRVDFDEDKDRLFLCGDLVNRGPDSKKCLSLVHLHWVYMVKGNHDVMFAEQFRRNNPTPSHMWCEEYMKWAAMVDSRILRDAADVIDAMPHIIVVGNAYDGTRFNVVHSAIAKKYFPVTDAIIDHHSDSLSANELMWNKTTSKWPNEVYFHGLSLTFCGHVPSGGVRHRWSHQVIDFGAGRGGRVRLIDINSALATFNENNQYGAPR